MHIRILTIVLLLVSASGYAQKFRVSLSDKHLKKVEKISKPSKKLKKYRKLYKKDSAQFIKDQEKQASKKLDSLGKALKNYAKTGIMDTLQFPEGYRKYLSKSMLDSGAITTQGKTWATTQGNKWMGENAEYKEYQKMMKDNPELSKWVNTYGSNPGALKDMPDSLFTYDNAEKTLTTFAEKQAGGLKEVQGLNKGIEAMSPITDMQDTYKSMGEGYMEQGKQYTDKEYLKEKGKEEAMGRAAKLAADFLAKDNGQLGQINKQLSKLKKKYSSLANSGDLSSGVKRKSLKGRPMDERFVLGGTFDVQIADPVKVDISPLIGFRITKPLTLGVGGTYRLDIGYDTRKLQYNNQVYGYNAFVSYDIIKQFFAYAEYDYMAETKLDTLTDQKVTVWQPAVVAGIGRSFKVHPKLTGTVMLLYHVVNSSIKNPAGNKFQVKFGFQTNELTFKKIKKPF